MRVATTWHKRRDIFSLLINKSLLLKYSSRVYDASKRSVLLLGFKDLPVTDRIASILRSCDKKMLRYITCVT